jgi:hypothetical protein
MGDHPELYEIPQWYCPRCETIIEILSVDSQTVCELCLNNGVNEIKEMFIGENSE